MAKLERIYTVPLGDAYGAPRSKRVPRAVKMLRAFIVRHMKADGEKITLSEALNKYLWRSSIQKPPRRVKVRLIKEEGLIRAYLADEKIEELKKEEKPAEKKEEKPEAKKEEKPPEKKEEKKPEAKEEKPAEKPVEKKEEKLAKKPEEKKEEKKPEVKEEEKPAGKKEEKPKAKEEKKAEAKKEKK